MNNLGFRRVDYGPIAGIRYFVAIVTIILLGYYVAWKTEVSDAWVMSTSIIFFSVFLLSTLCSMGSDKGYDDSAIPCRWMAKAFFMLSAVGLVGQGFFFLPLWQASLGIVLIPLMWFLVPRVYPEYKEKRA
ncbi:MAG: hypothetical protein E7019_05835 [Alphaproteobacteria bacterium]|nr:hypothetical protein [Alphaproteobacteria bacterium]